MPDIDASPADLKTVRALCQDFAPGVEVWAFGSRVTGTSSRRSDLDIALITEKPLDIGALADLKEALAESNLPFRVDVVDWAATAPRFQEIIARHHVVISPR